MLPYVLRGGLQYFGTVTKQTNATIAAMAQQPTNYPSVMMMVYACRVKLAFANRTLIILFFNESLHAALGHSVHALLPPEQYCS
jgi:hypothetical protein